MRALIFITLGAQHVSFAGELRNPDNKLRIEIQELLQSPNLKAGLLETVKVQFIVNKENRIELLAVDTNDHYLSTFIKYRMNNETINTLGIMHDELYQLDITFRAL
jgi:hypothetical protein